jgi:hypothetical protein
MQKNGIDFPFLKILEYFLGLGLCYFLVKLLRDDLLDDRHQVQDKAGRKFQCQQSTQLVAFLSEVHVRVLEIYLHQLQNVVDRVTVGFRVGLKTE